MKCYVMIHEYHKYIIKHSNKIFGQLFKSNIHFTFTQRVIKITHKQQLALLTCKNIYTKHCERPYVIIHITQHYSLSC